jgi:hypothetical protein
MTQITARMAAAGHALAFAETSGLQITYTSNRGIAVNI